MKYFKTAKELIENFLVDNVSIGDWVNEIVITDYAKHPVLDAFFVLKTCT